MKRHFSNRGEAISEVTAARFLASRKSAITASFMSPPKRRTNAPFWRLQRVEVRDHPRKEQPKRNDHDTTFL